MENKKGMIYIKTYKHLYNAMIDPEFIQHSIETASMGKRHRHSVQKILAEPDKIINQIIYQLNNKTWVPSQPTKTRLREGSHRKERFIQKPPFNSDQIIHHMLIRRIKPILTPRFYELSCGCIPGRGSSLVLKTMKKWIKKYNGQKFYVAELDIKKFYQNIDTELLKQQISKLIKDKDFLYPLFQVIDVSSPGLPLGYYTSPWLGNFYLTPLDRYILHQLKPDHYLRFIDNLFLFHTNKKKLHKIVQNIQNYCQNELHVNIKEDWQVFQFENVDKSGKIHGRAINCLGFVIHYNRITLRKSLLKRIRAKALRMHKYKKCKLIDAQAMVSYSGWLQHTDTYDYYYKYIKPNISFKYCKQLISKSAKRSNEHDKMETNSQLRTPN